MKHVYLMIDKEKNVVALYDAEELAQNMKKSIEDKLNVELTIEKRTVNQDIKIIGLVK